MFDFERVFYVAHLLLEAASFWNSLIVVSMSDLQELSFAFDFAICKYEVKI